MPTTTRETGNAKALRIEFKKLHLALRTAEYELEIVPLLTCSKMKTVAGKNIAPSNTHGGKKTSRRQKKRVTRTKPSKYETSSKTRTT